LVNSCGHCRGFRSCLLRFFGVFGTQVAQRSICHRVHSIEQHLCSWLLLMHDRSSGEGIEVTHDALGRVLGARREGVSIAIKHLRDAGLIVTARGRVTIRDHAALVERSCECYEVIRAAYDRWN
jgi:CRP-like cAMP-binding protein